MAEAERARARARGYALLGELFAEGLNPVSAVAWAQVEGVGPLEVDRASLERAAEAHTRLLTFEVQPYESVFLSPDAQLGGEVAAAVREGRGRAGLGDPSAHEPDHLGEELRWVGFLCAAEADALRDGVGVEALRRLQRDALDGHLLRWIAPCSMAVGLVARPGDHLFVHALDLAVALAGEHRASLGGAVPAWSLPVPPDVLADPASGLGAISRWMAIPAWLGGFLPRGVLRSIGRSLELPGGFGGRADVLHTLWESAAHYQRVPALCLALDAVLVGWVAEGKPPWKGRAEAARGLLRRIAGAA